ncbi:PAS domain S-box protein [Pedobacter nototheniae]|uniref:PAS domain S-box protein n=1 Tax=Pedobacter nototheniae TaxID=2488994 RepID=UPI002931A0F4|nr:PAS domain S-box protein [Pedobacter nototheniae]
MQFSNDQLLKDAVNNAPIGICILNADTLVSEIVNEKFVEIAGKPYGAIFGQFYWDVFAEARPYYEKALADVIKSGITYFAEEAEIVLLRQGRSENIFVNFVYKPVKDGLGIVKKVAVWAFENTAQVTARKEILSLNGDLKAKNEALAIDQQNIRQMILQAPVGMCLVSGSPLFVEEVNDVFLEIIGKQREPFYTIPYWEVNIEAKAIYEPVTDEVISTGETYKAKEHEILLVRNGIPETVFVDFVYEPMRNVGGDVTGIMIVATEVTDKVLARKVLQTQNTEIEASEARLDQVINQLPASITVLIGEDFVIERTNPSNLAYWQKTAEEVIGKPLLTALPELADQAFPVQLKQVLLTGISIFEKEHPVRLVSKNGETNTTFVDYSYQALTDKDGKRTGVLVMSNDVTEKVESRRLLEKLAGKLQGINEELAASNEELEATNEQLFKTQHTLEQSLKELGTSEGKFRLEKQRLERFFMQAPAGICILGGEDMVFELVNPLYQQFFSGRKLLNNPILTALPEIKGEPVWDLLQNVYQTGKTFEGRELLVPLARTDGGPLEDRYFDFIYQARLDEDEHIDGILAFVIEVTSNVQTRNEIERSRAELQKTEQLLRFAIDAADIGTFSYNSVNNQLITSQRFKTLFGYYLEDEVSYTDVMECVVLPYRETVGSQIEVAISQGTDFQMEFQIKGFHNDIVRWIRAVGKIDNHAKPEQQFFSGAITDITEQKKYEDQLKDNAEKNARLASIVSSTDDTILSKTLQGIITSWNPAAERMFGYSESEAIGQHISLIIPSSRLSEEDYIIGQVKAGKKIDHFETIRITKDGKEVPISLTVSPIYDDSGQVTGASKIARDISERQKDEIRKNDFIGMVSHELKTPLTSMIALIQLTKMQLSKKGDEFLAGAMIKAETQAKKMTKMINGFLNISRLESGKISIDIEQFDMASLLAELEHEVKMTHATHEIIFAPVEKTFVNADVDKIGHVINNLISNAVKYSSAGTSIYIACIQKDGYAVVSVKDEGIGIGTKHTALLFDRYYRVEEVSTKYIAGFGIGLYLSAEIIARHQGEIWVESELGTGSTFYFTLKLA